MPPLYTEEPPEPPEPLHIGIFDTIMEWGEEEWDKIKFAWQSSGGWKGWAQVELHYLFQGTTREDRAYRMPNNKMPLRTDLAFKGGHGLMDTKRSDPVQERVLVELKREWAKNRANFKAGVGL